MDKPTIGQAQSMEKIILKTEKTSDGYIAKCTVDGQPLQTKSYPLVMNALNHLIEVVVNDKKEKGQIRDFHYKFMT